MSATNKDKPVRLGLIVAAMAVGALFALYALLLLVGVAGLVANFLGYYTRPEWSDGFNYFAVSVAPSFLCFTALMLIVKVALLDRERK